MRPENVQPGDVVQINPDHDLKFGGCFMLVEEVAPWGFQGFVQIPARGKAYYRVPRESCIYIGQAEWMPEGTL